MSEEIPIRSVAHAYRLKFEQVRDQWTATAVRALMAHKLGGLDIIGRLSNSKPPIKVELKIDGEEYQLSDLMQHLSDEFGDAVEEAVAAAIPVELDSVNKKFKELTDRYFEEAQAVMRPILGHAAPDVVDLRAKLRAELIEEVREEVRREQSLIRSTS